MNKNKIRHKVISIFFLFLFSHNLLAIQQLKDEFPEMFCDQSVPDTNYKMPAGVPNTTVEFDQVMPVRPATWKSPVAGYYYVDLAIGSDTNNEFGSENSPRRSIPYPLSAGSYVEVAGKYNITLGGVIKISANGTNEAWVAGQKGPVWITTSPIKQGYFSDTKAVISGSNIYIDHMIAKEGSMIQIGSSSSGYPGENVVVRYSDFIGTLKTGTNVLLLAVGDHNTTALKNIIFYKNSFNKAGDILVAQDIDSGFIMVAGNANNVWILCNQGEEASGAAVQINPGGNRKNTHNIYVGHNEFSRIRQSGIWVKYGTDIVFSSNYIHDVISTSWSPAKGLGAQYEPDGLWIINNIIHDSEFGISIASTSAVASNESLNIFIIGNIIFNIKTETIVGGKSAWQSAGIFLQGGTERHVYNNLIFMAPNGINMPNHSGVTTIKNNIILNLTSSQSEQNTGYEIWSENVKDPEKIIIKNNIFSKESMKVKIVNQTLTTPWEIDASLGNNSNNKMYSLGEIAITRDENQVIPQLISVLKNENSAFFKASHIGDFPNHNINDPREPIYNNAGSSVDFIDTPSPVERVIQDIMLNPRKVGGAIDIGPIEYMAVAEYSPVAPNITSIKNIAVPSN